MKYIQAEDKYTDEELKKLDKLTNDLILWMFNRPNDIYPINFILKSAFDLGKKSKELEE